MKKVIFIISIFSALFSQQNQEFILKDVKVEGNIVSTENTIIFTSGLRKGLKVSSSEFPRAIKRLWQLGLFDDVQIKYDEEEGNEVSITLLVIESKVVGDVEYNGNRKIKASKFKEELEITTGQRIKPNMLHEKIKKMKKLYTEKGYLKVDIRADLVDSKNKQNIFDGKAKSITKDIVFTIEENDKVKINKIIFDGNESYSDFRLRRIFKETKQQRWYLFWRSFFDQNKFKEDKVALETFYRNNGYRDFYITSDTTISDPKLKNIDIVININEGTRYKYRNFTWDGNTLFDTNKLDRALNLNKGDYYNEEEFNVAVYNNMQGLYMDRGYIYSRLSLIHI